MIDYEYGVQWLAKDGRTFVGEGYSEAGAANTVARCGDPSLSDPHTVGVVRRSPGEWETVPAGEAT